MGLALCLIELNPQILAVHTMQGRCSTMPLGWSKTADEGKGRRQGFDGGVYGLVRFRDFSRSISQKG